MSKQIPFVSSFLRQNNRFRLFDVFMSVFPGLSLYRICEWRVDFLRCVIEGHHMTPQKPPVASQGRRQWQVVDDSYELRGSLTH